MLNNLCGGIVAALSMLVFAGLPCFSQDQPVKDKWAVIIGISKFRTRGHDLKYAAKDAQDWTSPSGKTGYYNGAQMD